MHTHFVVDKSGAAISLETLLGSGFRSHRPGESHLVTLVQK